MAQKQKQHDIGHRCAWGILIPMHFVGMPTSYILVDDAGRMISHKARCGHGIVKPHCKKCQQKRTNREAKK